MKRRIYIPTQQNHEGEHYPSFEAMIAARPELTADKYDGTQPPYTCEYPDDDVMVV